MSQPLLNRTGLDEITHGDPEMERELMALFIKTAEDCLRRLQMLAGSGEQDWKNVVHELRGAAANIHAEELAYVCREAEKAGDALSRTQAGFEIRAAFERLRPLLTERSSAFQ